MGHLHLLLFFDAAEKEVKTKPKVGVSGLFGIERSHKVEICDRVIDFTNTDGLESD